ncbi:MAG: flippase-like domain-containing protein, partial [Bacteroidaceae bacterium]|nr:flippase-like domain-containing protein [Bacteroidaceae bacterium]
MYQGVDWSAVWRALDSDMNWTWMLLSMPFGISAQMFRALRWKVALKPLGENPRLSTCCNSIFLSYASSLAIPRVGEVLRCGVLSKYEDISFTKLVGSVVSERIVDMSMVFLFSLLTALTQIPVFLNFFHETGIDFRGFLGRFSTSGYIVTAICTLAACILMYFLAQKLNLISRTKAKFAKLIEGMTSITHLQNPWLFLLYSCGIWASYYMHFYLAFYCFDYTAQLGPVAALVAFVVGCFAVLVPTPNGAGPWHFVVKTVLVLYGVQDQDAAVFALIVHTLQTLLTVVLGLYALAS